MLWRVHACTSPFTRIWSVHDQDYACVLASWNISKPERETYYSKERVMYYSKERGILKRRERHAYSP